MLRSKVLDFAISRGVKLTLALLCASAFAISGCDTSDAASAEQHLQRATEYRDQGDLRAAVIELKNALQKEPQNAEARWQLGQTYVALGQAAAATKELERAQELGYQSEELTVQLLEALLLQGNFQKVLATLAEIDSGETDPRLLILSARAQLGLGQIEEAEEAFRAVLETTSGSTEARLGLAGVAVDRRDLDEAERQANLALEAGGDNLKAWLLKGELALLRDRFEDAELAFRTALDQAEANVPARIGLARALLGLSDAENARKQLNALTQLKVDAPVISYLTALLARQEGDLEGTERALREVLSAAPNHPQSLLLLGAIQLGKGEQAQAEELLTRFLALIPNHPAGSKLLATLQLQQNRLEPAIELLLKAELRTPEDAQLLVMLGNAYMRQGDLEKGREYLARAVNLAPDSPVLRAQLAAGHLAAGATEEAVAELESVIAQRPDFARADLLLVLTHLRTGDFDLALQASSTLSEKHPESALPHNLMGAAREGQQNKEEARSHYEHALKIQPDYSAAALNLARMDYQAGAVDVARMQYEKILEQHENQPTALVALARIAQGEGRTTQAIDYLERARQAHERFLVPRLMLAEHYLKSGRVPDALAAAEEAQKIAAEDPRVLTYLGRAQLASGETQDAVTAFERLTARAPESAGAHFQLGLARMRAGDTEGARASLERALELKGDSLPARVALGNLALLTRQPHEALSQARLLKEQHPGAVAGEILEGDTYMAKGELQRAIAAYERALERAQTSPLIIKLHTAKVRAGAVEDALVALRKRLADYPEDVSVRLALAQTLHQSDKREAAVDEYQRVLESHPRNAVALNNLAWIYHEHGDARGLKLAEKAYGLVPQNPEIADTYGWLLVQSDNVEQGLRILQMAAKAAPGKGDIRYHFAAGLARAGDRETARKELEALLSTNETFSERLKAEQLLKILE